MIAFSFSDMLKMGKSRPWPEALKKGTGSEKLTAVAIKEYFAPLDVWLREQRNTTGYPKGWVKTPTPTPTPKKTTPAGSGAVGVTTITALNSLLISVVAVVLFQRFSC